MISKSKILTRRKSKTSIQKPFPDVNVTKAQQSVQIFREPKNDFVIEMTSQHCSFNDQVLCHQVSQDQRESVDELVIKSPDGLNCYQANDNIFCQQIDADPDDFLQTFSNDQL